MTDETQAMRSVTCLEFTQFAQHSPSAGSTLWSTNPKGDTVASLITSDTCASRPQDINAGEQAAMRADASPISHAHLIDNHKRETVRFRQRSHGGGQLEQQVRTQFQILHTADEQLLASSHTRARGTHACDINAHMDTVVPLQSWRTPRGRARSPSRSRQGRAEICAREWGLGPKTHSMLHNIHIYTYKLVTYEDCLHRRDIAGSLDKDGGQCGRVAPLHNQPSV